MTQLPPQTSRFKQSLAVTLVTALVLSMPGTTGWAANKNSSQYTVVSQADSNSNAPGMKAVGTNGYIPLFDAGTQKQGIYVSNVPFDAATMRTVPQITQLANINKQLTSGSNVSGSIADSMSKLMQLIGMFPHNAVGSYGGRTMDSRTPGNSLPVDAVTTKVINGIEKDLTGNGSTLPDGTPYQTLQDLNYKAPQEGVDAAQIDNNFHTEYSIGAVHGQVLTSEQSLSNIDQLTTNDQLANAQVVLEREGTFEAQVRAYNATGPVIVDAQSKIADLNQEIEDVKNHATTCTSAGTGSAVCTTLTPEELKAKLDPLYSQLKDVKSTLDKLQASQRDLSMRIGEVGDQLKDDMSLLTPGDIAALKADYAHQRKNPTMASIINGLDGKNTAEILEKIKAQAKAQILQEMADQQKAYDEAAKKSKSSKLTRIALSTGAGVWGGMGVAAAIAALNFWNPIGWTIIAVGAVAAGAAVYHALGDSSAEAKEKAAKDQQTQAENQIKGAAIGSVAWTSLAKREMLNKALGNANALYSNDVNAAYRNGDIHKQIKAVADNENTLGLEKGRIKDVIAAMEAIKAGQNPVGTSADVARQLLNQKGGVAHLTDNDIHNLENQFASDGALAAGILQNHVKFHNFIDSQGVLQGQASNLLYGTTDKNFMNLEGQSRDALYTKADIYFVNKFMTSLGLSAGNNAGLNGFVNGFGLDSANLEMLENSAKSYEYYSGLMQVLDVKEINLAAAGDVDAQAFVDEYIGRSSVNADGSVQYFNASELTYKELADQVKATGQIPQMGTVGQYAQAFNNIQKEMQWVDAVGGQFQHVNDKYLTSQGWSDTWEGMKDNPLNVISFVGGAALAAGVMVFGSVPLIVGGSVAVVGSILTQFVTDKLAMGDQFKWNGTLSTLGSGVAGFLTVLPFAGATGEAAGMVGQGAVSRFVGGLLKSEVSPNLALGEDALVGGESGAASLGREAINEGGGLARELPETTDGPWSWDYLKQAGSNIQSAIAKAGGWGADALSWGIKAATIPGRLTAQLTNLAVPYSLAFYGADNGLNGTLTPAGLMNAMTLPSQLLWHPLQEVVNDNTQNLGFAGSVIRTVVGANAMVGDMAAFGVGGQLANLSIARLLGVNAEKAIAMRVAMAGGQTPWRAYAVDLGTKVINQAPMLSFYEQQGKDLSDALKTGDMGKFAEGFGSLVLGVAGAHGGFGWEGNLSPSGASSTSEAPLSLNRIESGNLMPDSDLIGQPAMKSSAGVLLEESIKVGAISVLGAINPSLGSWAAGVGAFAVPVLDEAYKQNRAEIEQQAVTESYVQTNILKVGDLISQGSETNGLAPAAETVDRAVALASERLTTKPDGQIYLGDRPLTSEELKNPVIEKALENKANPSAPETPVVEMVSVEKAQIQTEIDGLKQRLYGPERDESVIPEIQRLQEKLNLPSPEEQAAPGKGETAQELSTFADRELALNNNLIRAQKNLVAATAEAAPEKGLVSQVLADVAKAQRDLTAHFEEKAFFNLLPGGDREAAGLAALSAGQHRDAAALASHISVSDAKDQALFRTTGDLNQAQAKAAFDLLGRTLTPAEHAQTMAYMAEHMLVSRDAKTGNLQVNGVHVPENLMPVVEQVYNGQRGIEGEPVTIKGTQIKVNLQTFGSPRFEVSLAPHSGPTASLETPAPVAEGSAVHPIIPTAELRSNPVGTLTDLRQKTDYDAKVDPASAEHQESIGTERAAIQFVKQSVTTTPEVLESLDARLTELDAHQAVVDAQAEMLGAPEGTALHIDAQRMLGDAQMKLAEMLNAHSEDTVSASFGLMKGLEVPSLSPEAVETFAEIPGSDEPGADVLTAPLEGVSDKTAEQRFRNQQAALELESVKAQMRGDALGVKRAQAEQDRLHSDAYEENLSHRLPALEQAEEAMDRRVTREKPEWIRFERLKNTDASPEEIARRAENRETATWQVHAENIRNIAEGKKPWSESEISKQISERADLLNESTTHSDPARAQENARQVLDQARESVHAEIESAHELGNLYSQHARMLTDAHTATEASKRAQYLSEIKGIERQIERARLSDGNRVATDRLGQLEIKANGTEGLKATEVLEQARLRVIKAEIDYRNKMLDANSKEQIRLEKEAESRLKPLRDAVTKAERDVRTEQYRAAVKETRDAIGKISGRIENLKAAEPAIGKLADILARRFEANDDAFRDAGKPGATAEDRAKAWIERAALFITARDIADEADSSKFAEVAEKYSTTKDENLLIDYAKSKIDAAKKVAEDSLRRTAGDQGKNINEYVAGRPPTGDVKGALSDLRQAPMTKSQDLQIRSKRLDLQAQRAGALIDLQMSNNPLSKMLARGKLWNATRELRNLAEQDTLNILKKRSGDALANGSMKMSKADAEKTIKALYDRLNEGLFQKKGGFTFMGQKGIEREPGMADWDVAKRTNQYEALEALLTGKSLNLETSGGKSLLAAMFAAMVEGQVVYIGPDEALAQKLGTSDNVGGVSMKDLIEQSGLIAWKKVYNIDELYRNYNNGNRQELLNALTDAHGVLLMSREVHGFLYSATKNDTLLRDAWNKLGADGVPVRVLADEVHNLADPMNFIMSDASDKTLDSDSSAWKKSKAMASIFKTDAFKQIPSTKGDVLARYRSLDSNKSSEGIGWYYDQLTGTAYLTDAAVAHIQNVVRNETGLDATTSDIVSFAKGWGQADLGRELNRPIGAVIGRVVGEDGALKYKVIPVDGSSKRQDTMTYSDSIYAASFAHYMEAHGLASDSFGAAVEKVEASPSMVPLSSTKMQVAESQAMSRYNSMQGMTGTSDGVRSLLRDKLAVEIATISSARDRQLESWEGDGDNKVTMKTVADRLAPADITNIVDRIQKYVAERSDPKSDSSNNGFSKANLRRALLYGLNAEEQTAVAEALRSRGLSVELAGARDLNDGDIRSQLTAEAYYDALKKGQTVAAKDRPVDVVILTSQTGIEGVNWRGEYIEIGNVSDLSTSKYKQFINRVERSGESGNFAADRYFFTRDSSLNTLLGRLAGSEAQQNALLNKGIWYSDLSKTVEVFGKETTVGALAEKHLAMLAELFLKATPQELRERAVLLENHPGLAEINGKLYDMKSVLKDFIAGKEITSEQKALLAMHYRQAIVLTNGFRGEISEAFSKTMNLDPLQRLYMDALKRESDAKELVASSPSTFTRNELSRAEDYRKAVETAFQQATNPESTDASYKPEKDNSKPEDTVRNMFESQRAASVRVWKALQEAVPYAEIKGVISEFVTTMSAIDANSVSAAREGVSASDVQTVEQALAYGKKLSNSMLPMESNEGNPAGKLEQRLSKVFNDLKSSGGGPRIDSGAPRILEQDLVPGGHSSRPVLEPVVSEGSESRSPVQVLVEQGQQISMVTPAAAASIPTPGEVAPLATPAVLTISQIYSIRTEAIQLARQMGNNVPVLIGALAATGSVQEAADILYAHAGVAALPLPSIGFGGAYKAFTNSEDGFVPQAWKVFTQTTRYAGRQGFQNALTWNPVKAVKGIATTVLAPISGLFAAMIPAQLSAYQKANLLLGLVTNPQHLQNITGKTYQNLALMAGQGLVTPEQVISAMDRMRSAPQTNTSTSEAIKAKLNNILGIALSGTSKKITIGDGYMVQRVNGKKGPSFILTVNTLNASAGLKAMSLVKLAELSRAPMEFRLPGGDADHLQAFNNLVDKANSNGAQIKIVESGDASSVSTMIPLGLQHPWSWMRSQNDADRGPVALLTQVVSSIEQKAAPAKIDKGLTQLRSVAGQLQEAVDLGLIRKDHLSDDAKALIRKLESSANSNTQAREDILAYLGQSVSDAHASLIHEGKLGNAPIVELKTDASIPQMLQRLLTTDPNSKTIVRALRNPQTAAQAAKRLRDPQQTAAYKKLSTADERYRQDLLTILTASLWPTAKGNKRAASRSETAMPALQSFVQFVATPDAILVVGDSFDYATLQSLRTVLLGRENHIITTEAYRDYTAEKDRVAEEARQSAIQAMLPALPEQAAEQVAAPKSTLMGTLHDAIGKIFISNPLPVLGQTWKQRPVFVSAIIAITTALAVHALSPHGIFPGVTAALTPFTSLFGDHANTATGTVGLSMAFGGRLRSFNKPTENVGVRARGLRAELMSA